MLQLALRAAGPVHRRYARPVFLLPLIFVLGVFAARLPSTLAHLGLAGDGDFFAPISDVRSFLEDDYVQAPDMDALRRGAIDGMLEALDDPYAEYIPPAQRAEFEKLFAGQYVGIGATVDLDGGYLSIISPMEDSPALEAGIRAGDKIVEIEGKTTLGMTIDQCIAVLTGEPGSEVNIVVQRDSARLPMTVKRRKVTVRAVEGVRRVQENAGHWDYWLDPERRIAYVRLNQFIPTAAEELAKVLAEIGADKPAGGAGGLGGLILDLRNNPGGDLVVCLEIADMFLKDGTIVSVKGRDGGGEAYAASAEDTLPDFPMAVLVNGQSASASEILAGALADHGRACVIGSRTYGKGLVQTVRDLPHQRGGQVKFTVQRYYLPSGRMINRADDSTVWGVDPMPGFYIPMSPEEELDAFLRRRNRDVIGGHPPLPADPGSPSPPAPAPEQWSEPEWIEGEGKDRQLAGGLRAVQGHLSSGTWTPVSDATQQPAAISRSELTRLERVQKVMLREIMRVENRIAALDGAASPAAARAEPDLWPNSLDLTGGRVEVFDKDGKPVSRLRITGRDVERWLSGADVEAVAELPATPASQPADEPIK